MRQFRLRELAELIGAELVGDAEHIVTGLEALEHATREDVSFLANPRYKEAMLKSQAGVICIAKNLPLPEGKNFLVTDDPSHAFQIIAKKMLGTDEQRSAYAGIHETALVHPSVVLGQDVHIGPYAVVDQGCTLGDGVRIGPFVSLGAGVSIGANSLLYAHVVVREGCTIGARVILQPGVVIGSCGFGYITDSQGCHQKLEQLGNVIIEDDVEIGANTTIDRARFKTTRISRGTKIDNLVQIGHNVTLGEHNIIVSQTGIAGSTKTGKHVICGGQVGIVGHVEIADNVLFATRSGVSKSIKESGKYAGSPVMPLGEYNKQQVLLRKIEEYVDKIEKLEERIQELEKQSAIR